MHPLKALSLLSWAALLGFQFMLLVLDSAPAYYWVILSVVLLLIPAYGLFVDRRYTYKWIGFLTMLYFCIGISELVSNPALRIYGAGTTIFSTTLFIASIYYARFLGLRTRT